MRIGYKAQPVRSTQFRYDGLGRRTATLSNNGAASTETRHLWCGDSLCQSRTAADTVTRRYYPEGELRPQGNTLLYYHRDHLGSVRDVTNLPNAARIAAFDYGPYGTPAQTSGRLSTDFRYAGMFYLQEAGLYLTRHRAYDPDNARWLSRDPIGEAGGINLYGYVGGDPVNWVDPLGLEPICAGNGQNIVCTDGQRPPPEGTPINGPLSPVGVAATVAEIAAAACPIKPAAKNPTEIIQRWMSKAELEATQKTSLLRGGRNGTHFVTNSANTDPLRARQRLALPQTPELRVTLEVPQNRLSPPSIVEPAFNMSGGGIERTANGDIPVKILEVQY